MRKLQNRKVARGWGRRATFLGDCVRTLRSPCRVLPSRPGFVEHLAGGFLRRRVHKHRLDARVVDDVDLPARQYLFELEPARTVAAANNPSDHDLRHVFDLLGGIHDHCSSVGHGGVGIRALPTRPMRGHLLFRLHGTALDERRDREKEDAEEHGADRPSHDPRRGRQHAEQEAEGEKEADIEGDEPAHQAEVRQIDYGSRRTRNEEEILHENPRKMANMAEVNGEPKAREQIILSQK